MGRPSGLKQPTPESPRTSNRRRTQVIDYKVLASGDRKAGGDPKGDEPKLPKAKRHKYCSALEDLPAVIAISLKDLAAVKQEFSEPERCEAILEQNPAVIEPDTSCVEGQSLIRDHLTRLESLIEDSEPSEQVFPLIFACLSQKVVNLIPGAVDATLREIAAETNAKVAATEKKTWLYGSLSDITSVESALAKVRAEAAEEIIEAEIQDEEEEEEGEEPANEETPQSLEEIVKSLVDPTSGEITDDQNGELCVTLEAVDDDDDDELRESYSKPVKREGRRNNRTDNTLEKDMVQCSNCDYRSNKINIRKHAKRHHSEMDMPCEICHQTFVIRYDFRIHRLNHFYVDGSLTAAARDLIQSLDNETAKDFTLMDLEPNYRPLKIKTDGVAEADGEVTIEDFIPDSMTHSDVAQRFRNLDDIPVGCGACKSQLNFGRMQKHHFLSHKRYVFKCPVCALEFTRPVLFEQHAKDSKECAPHLADTVLHKYSDRLPCQCSVCSKDLINRNIKSHLLDEHPLPVVCLTCDESFPSEVKFCVHHLKEHADPDAVRKAFRCATLPSDGTYECEECGRLCNNWTAYASHRRAHGPDQIFECEKCGFIAKKQGIFNQHMRDKHTGSLKCKICDREYQSKGSLRTHVRMTHDSGVVTCDLCQRNFNHSRYLESHIRRFHQQEKKFFCGHCGKGFFEKQQQMRHELGHEGLLDTIKRHSCSYCGHTFINKSQLTQHENSHTGTKPFKCDLCPKAFFRSSLLAKHKRAHSDAKPHRCQLCGKGFKFPYKLTAHMTIHTKEGRHRCPDCHKVFTAYSTLRKHNCKPEDSVVMEANTNANQIHVIRSEDISLQVDAEEVLRQVAEAASEVKKEKGEDCVMYMCGACNALFEDQDAVNEHICEQEGIVLVMDGNGVTDH